jgi:hypothetical protein
MFAALLTLTLTAAPFPLPAIDGKPLAVIEGQKSFRLPMRFERVRAFYEERFKAVEGVSVRINGTSGSRTLELVTTRTTDSWKSAKVKEGETETVVDVKAVMQMTGDNIAGKGPPVEFILTRSAEVQGALKSIDHTESMKGP